MVMPMMTMVMPLMTGVIVMTMNADDDASVFGRRQRKRHAPSVINCKKAADIAETMPQLR